MAINNSYIAGIGICLGVFHIICGVTSFACGIALRAYEAKLSHVGMGIWAGILFYILTGVLGFAAATKKNSVITAYYIMALLSVLVSMAQMGVYSYALYEEAFICSDSYYKYEHLTEDCAGELVRNIFIDSTVVLAAFVEWIIAMVSCCTACVCCFRSDPPQPQTVMVTTMHQPMVGQQAYGVPAGMVITQSPYGGPATMMQPPQAAYGGGFPAQNPGASMKPPYADLEASFGDPYPPAFNNGGFDQNDEKPIVGVIN